VNSAKGLHKRAADTGFLELDGLQANAGDTTQVVRQGGAHVEELLHPGGAVDADVENSVFVEAEEFPVLGEGTTAGYGPGGGEAVFVGELAEAATERVAEDVAHSLHRPTLCVPRCEVRRDLTQRVNELEVSGARGWFGAAEKEGLTEAGGVGGGYVRAAVTDEKRLRQVQIEVTGGAENHAGRWFAVFVLALVFTDGLRVIRAVVSRGERGVAGGELAVYPSGEDVEVRLGVDAATDACLVGDHNEFVAEVGGAVAEGEDAGNPADVFDAVEVVGLLVDDAVTVEEEGWGGHTSF
jgi:hypothetical protein